MILRLLLALGISVVGIGVLVALAYVMKWIDDILGQW